MVVAPATANIMAKLAHGIADDMLSTTLLATKAPILLAPARNTGMDCLSVAWGFRSEEILRAAGATTILRTPQELKKAVLG